jgi:hypothetical protein
VLRSDLNERDQSKQGFIPCTIDVKTWQRELPSVASVRPPSCPWCGAASRVVGAKLSLYGHGVRERQQWGPSSPGSPPEFSEVLLRRYRCCECSGICVVGPASIVRKRLYSGGAIAWALALYGLLKYSIAAVRRHTSPWSVVGAAASGGWHSLRRWLRAVRERALWPQLRAVPTAWTGRQIAEHVAASVSAQAPPARAKEPIEARAFHGAAQPLCWMDSGVGAAR